MEASTYNFTVYRGSPVNIPLAFTSEDTGDPMALTGLQPFKCQVRDSDTGPLLLEITVDETDLANGLLTLTASTADTEKVPIRKAYWDLIDANETVWLEGVVSFKRRISKHE